MSQEQDFQEIEEEYEAEENAKHDMRMRRMGEMPVGRLILTMSWPAMIAMLIQAFYNIVDSFFVAQISEDAMTTGTGGCYICVPDPDAADLYSDRNRCRDQLSDFQATGGKAV